MHDTTIITASRTLVGSYNLSYQARQVYNKESLYCLATTQEYVDAFDRDWASLSDRVLDVFNPNAALFEPNQKKRKATNQGSKKESE